MNDKTEFRRGDFIVEIGHLQVADVLTSGSRHYFVRWVGHGESMLWIDQVDRDYVLVGRGIDDD